MKKSRYSDSQILAILKQNETGAKVADLCREHGMSEATFYKWRAKYGGMDASLMKRLKDLEDENDPAAAHDRSGRLQAGLGAGDHDPARQHR